MALEVTIRETAPPPRGDGVAYTKARIQESAAETGSWNQIDELTLSPIDADPADPGLRTLTSTKATLEAGWYRVVWADAAGVASQPSEPIRRPPYGPRPSVADVAALLRARTKIAGGTEAGTFTAKTRPTNAEVEDLIDEALSEVLGKVKAPTAGTDYERRVRGAIRLYTAILVELSYFPEQVASAKSPAATYQALYDKRIASLIAESQTGEPQGEGGAGGSPSPPDAAYTFPGGAVLVGWGTRW